MRKVIGIVVAAVLLVVASVAVTLYVTSDSRSGIEHTTVEDDTEAKDEARYVCDHTNAAAVEVTIHASAVGRDSEQRRYEC